MCAAFHDRAGQLGLTQAGDAQDFGTVNWQISFGIVLPKKTVFPPPPTKIGSLMKLNVSDQKGKKDGGRRKEIS